jgi:ferredoxin
MTDLDDISARSAASHLAIFGAFHTAPQDDAPPGCLTLVLLGPDEPGFWAHVRATPEFADPAPDPLDRWSRRVIGGLARDLGASALFPFGGPPWASFIAWAKRSGRAWDSPVSLLVHDRAGLMVSYRGALAFDTRLPLPDHPPATRPCTGCPQPCRSACPVDALDASGYDTAACHRHLDTVAGNDCLTTGCRVRRACPISQTYGRQPAQSAHHMRSFHP